MKQFFESSFSTSIPAASVIFSVLYIIFEDFGFFIIAAICVAIPALIFLCLSIYIFFQFGRYSLIEVDLDSLQIGLIQLSIIMVIINSFKASALI